MLDKNSAIPLHTQLATVLRRQIYNQELLPNTQLPSEREFCDAHGISRITVRNALDELFHEGLIYKAVGKGTYVAEWTLNEELRPLNSFSEDMAKRGMRVTSRVLEAQIIAADDALADQLHVPRGAEAVRLYRLRFADDTPIALQLSHLPHHLCPDLLARDFGTCSLFAVLRADYKLRLTRADTTISAALARAEEAELLLLPAPAAVLISEQTTYLEDDTTPPNGVIEVTRSVFRSDRYKLHMTY